MEPGIKETKNQYSVGEYGRFVDKNTERLVEGQILSVIDDLFGLSESVYLRIRTDRGVRTIKVS